MLLNRTFVARLTAGVAVIVLIAFATIGVLPSNAQTPSPAAAEHPLVGSWLYTGGDPTFVGALFSFDSDGIALVSLPGGRTAHGVWSPTGEHSAAFTFVMAGTDRAGAFSELDTFEGSLEVSAAGNAWSGMYMVERVAPGETSAFSASPQATIDATRITLENGTDGVFQQDEPEIAATPAS